MADADGATHHPDMIKGFNGPTTDLAAEPSIMLNPSPDAPQKDINGNLMNKPSADDGKKSDDDVKVDVIDDAKDAKNDVGKDDEDEDKFFEKQASAMAAKVGDMSNKTKDDDDSQNLRTFHDAANSKAIDQVSPTEENLSKSDESLVKSHLGLSAPLTDSEEGKRSGEKGEKGEKGCKKDKLGLEAEKCVSDSNKLVNEMEDGDESRRIIEHHIHLDDTTDKPGVSRSSILKTSPTKLEARGTRKGTILEPMLVSNQTKIESAKDAASLDGVGALSQTIEYHLGGNSSMHVTNHTNTGMNLHKSIFSTKLHDSISRFPQLKPMSMFRRPKDVFESNGLNEQMVRSTLPTDDHLSTAQRSGKEFAEKAGDELEDVFNEQTLKGVAADKRTRIDTKTKAHMQQQEEPIIDHMEGGEFGKFSHVEMPGETDPSEVQQRKVDRILKHFEGGAKRGFSEFTTFTEVPYYRAIKKMYHSLLNHEAGLSANLRPEQIRGISLIANEIKYNSVASRMKVHPRHQVESGTERFGTERSGNKRNSTFEGGPPFADTAEMVLSETRTATLPGAVSLGEMGEVGGDYATPYTEPAGLGGLGGGELLDPVIPQGTELNFDYRDIEKDMKSINKDNLATMKADMSDEDSPPSRDSMHASLKQHGKHKKHMTQPKDSKDSVAKDSKDSVSKDAKDSVAKDAKDSVAKQTKDSVAKDIKDAATAKINEEMPKKQKESTKSSEQRDSSHDPITADLIKEQTKLTEPKEPTYDDKSKSADDKLGGDKNKAADDKDKMAAFGSDGLDKLKSLEKEFRANQHSASGEKQNQTREMMQAMEIEELGKEFQNNEILLKGEDKSSHANETKDEDHHEEEHHEKRVKGKSNAEIEGENKVILGKIMDLIHQIKPLHFFGENVTASELEDIAFHNELNSYFHNAFGNLELKTETTGDLSPVKSESTGETGSVRDNVEVQKSARSHRRCPLNALCSDTEEMVGGETSAAFKQEGEDDNSEGTLGAERDETVTGAKKGNIEYAHESNRKNGIHAPSAPLPIPDQPHMSMAMQHIGHARPMMNMPARPLAHPEHPPGFKSLFEHQDTKKKDSMGDDLNEIKKEMNKVSDKVSLMKESLTGEAEEPMIGRYQLDKASLRTRTSMNPELLQKKALFYDDRSTATGSKRGQVKLNNTLENIYKAINQGNNDGFIHQLESLALQKKTPLDSELKESLGVSAFLGKEEDEKENIMHKLEKMAATRKDKHNMFFERSEQEDGKSKNEAVMMQLRKLALQKKKSKFESNGGEMMNKYRVTAVPGNKKHTLEGSPIGPRSPGPRTLGMPVNENSVRTNGLDNDLFLNDQDLSTLQPSPQSTAAAMKKENLGTRERTGHEVDYLKEDDFPRSFPYNSFSLEELPKLPVEKSYVISPPHAGSLDTSGTWTPILTYLLIGVHEWY